MSDGDDPTGSVDAFLELVSSARATHSLFQAYVTAGFTESQAMRLVVMLITAVRSQA